MNALMQQLAAISRWWQSARARLRLLIGAVVVAAVGLAGLTPQIWFGLSLTWPYAALIAAVGWGRSGLAFTPMALLMLFGFAQDVTSSAPMGCFALVNLATYGASAALNQTFDIERAAGMNFFLPVGLLVLGVVLVWLLASFAGGYVARALPLVSAFFSTLLLHTLIAPVFDLGIRRGSATGAMT